jgi:hypothetical protein
MKKISELRGTPIKNKSKLPDPPMVVLLKRKAIRYFPNGQRVALYHNDQLKLDVSVPYFPGQLDKDKNEIAYSAIHERNTIWKKLGAIAKGKPGDITFPNGEVLKNVQPSVAASIAKLRGLINTYNRERLSDKVNRSSGDFNEVVKFIKANDIQ